MAAIFSITDGPPGGRERIAWWRASKRERGAKIAAMPHYKRHSYLDRLNIDKMLIRHISFQVMEDAAEKRRSEGLPTEKARKRHRWPI